VEVVDEVEDEWAGFLRDLQSEALEEKERTRKEHFAFFHALPRLSQERYVSLLDATNPNVLQLLVFFQDFALVGVPGSTKEDLQDMLTELGILDRVLALVEASKRFSRDVRDSVQVECLHLLFVLLLDGNRLVQETLIGNPSCKEVLIPLIQLSLSSQNTNVTYALEVMQQVCEGHNLAAQLLLHPLVDTSTNLVCLLCRRDPKGALVELALKTLVELIQGPCSDNQVAVMSKGGTFFDLVFELSLMRGEIMSQFRLLCSALLEGKHYLKHRTMLKEWMLTTGCTDEYLLSLVVQDLPMAGYCSVDVAQAGAVFPYTFERPSYMEYLSKDDRKVIVQQVDRTSPQDKHASLVEYAERYRDILKAKESMLSRHRSIRQLNDHSPTVERVLVVISLFLVVLFNAYIVFEFGTMPDEVHWILHVILLLCYACKIVMYGMLQFAIFWTWVPLLYRLCQFVFVFLALFVHPGFYAVLMIDCIVQSSTMSSLFKSLRRNASAIALTLIAIVILVYLFSLYAFYVIPESENRCSSVRECFAVLVQSFPSASDVYVKELTATLPENFTFTVLFWLVCVILMLNILFGLIVDSFGEEREERQLLREDCKSKCYICDISASMFDRSHVPVGFRGHTRYEHSMWDYVALICAVLDKRDAGLFTDMNGVESYVDSCLKETRYVFFPLNAAFWMDEKVRAAGLDGKAQSTAAAALEKDEMARVLDTVEMIVDRCETVEREVRERQSRIEAVQSTVQVQCAVLQQQAQDLMKLASAAASSSTSSSSGDSRASMASSSGPTSADS
jgi:hypothetical protein